MSNFINRQKTLGQAETIALEDGLDLLLEDGSSFLTEAEDQINYTNRPKNISSLATNSELGFLLTQDGFYLLQQNGYRILLQESTGSIPANWINRVKS